jgi:hypothetical protein
MEIVLGLRNDDQVDAHRNAFERSVGKPPIHLIFPESARSSAVLFSLTQLQPFAVKFRYDPTVSLTADQREEIRLSVAILRGYVVTRILDLERAAKP